MTVALQLTKCNSNRPITVSQQSGARGYAGLDEDVTVGTVLDQATGNMAAWSETLASFSTCSTQPHASCLVAGAAPSPSRRLRYKLSGPFCFAAARRSLRLTHGRVLGPSASLTSCMRPRSYRDHHPW